MTRTTALLLSLATLALWAFFRIADLTLAGQAETWNITVMQQMPAWQAAWLNPLVIGLTQCGSVLGLTVGGLLTVTLLVRHGHRHDAGLVGLLLIGTAVWTFGLKAVYLHPRPQVFLPLVTETGYSFPSGHALAGWSFFGYLTIWSLAHDRHVSATAAGLMALALPLSRLYLGVHWPTDVLAGICVGTTWLCLCLALRLHLITLAQTVNPSTD
jgi:undecaprenyl-diphosphatase